MRLVLRCLDDHARDQPVCRLSQRRIAQWTGYGEAQVRRTLRLLKTDGLIWCRRRSCADGRLADEIGICWANFPPDEAAAPPDPTDHGGPPTDHGGTPTDHGDRALNRLSNRLSNRPPQSPPQPLVGAGRASVASAEAEAEAVGDERQKKAEDGAEGLEGLSLEDLAKPDRFEHTFAVAAGDPRTQLADSDEDRLAFLAFLVAFGRERRASVGTPHEIQRPRSLAVWRLAGGRRRWTETIRREDRDRAKELLARMTRWKNANAKR